VFDSNTSPSITFFMIIYKLGLYVSISSDIGQVVVTGTPAAPSGWRARRQTVTVHGLAGTACGLAS
jgi:hypothetical protein